MSLLIDTNVLIDYIDDVPTAVRFLERLPGKPTISVCTIMELYAGGARSRRRASHRDVGDDVECRAGQRSNRKGRGQHMRDFARSHGLDYLDALIAATAEHHGLELATLNDKHFPMFKRLKAAY